MPLVRHASTFLRSAILRRCEGRPARPGRSGDADEEGHREGDGRWKTHGRTGRVPLGFTDTRQAPPFRPEKGVLADHDGHRPRIGHREETQVALDSQGASPRDTGPVGHSVCALCQVRILEPELLLQVVEGGPPLLGLYEDGRIVAGLHGGSVL